MRFSRLDGGLRFALQLDLNWDEAIAPGLGVFFERDGVMVTFRTQIQRSGNATGIPVPEEAVLGLGAGKRVAVVVTVGDYTYRSTVGPYRGQYLIPLSAEHRGKAGLAGGEEVEVTLEVDSAPREVEVPDDLAAALKADPTAAAAFEALSYTGKRQHTLAVEGAKTPETRQRRIVRAIAALRGDA